MAGGAAHLGVQEVVGEQRRALPVESEAGRPPLQRRSQLIDVDPAHGFTLRCAAMPTSWEQMFNTGTASTVAAEGDPESRGGLFSRMRDSLSKSRRAMTQQLAAVMFDPADGDVWERLEEALIAADCGVAATVEVIERLEAEAESGGLRSSEELSERLAAIVAELMTPSGDPRIDVSHRPAVVLMTGVNGTGKTTSIGKIAHHLRDA